MQDKSSKKNELKKGPSPLQLISNEDYMMALSRSEPYMNSDEDVAAMRRGNLFSEGSFTNVSQNVEKSVIDYFGCFKNGNQVISDITFIGALRAFNAPLIKDFWFQTNENFLKLPSPFKFDQN